MKLPSNGVMKLMGGTYVHMYIHVGPVYPRNSPALGSVARYPSSPAMTPSGANNSSSASGKHNKLESRDYPSQSPKIASPS